MKESRTAFVADISSIFGADLLPEVKSMLDDYSTWDSSKTRPIFRDRYLSKELFLERIGLDPGPLVPRRGTQVHGMRGKARATLIMAINVCVYELETRRWRAVIADLHAYKRSRLAEIDRNVIQLAHLTDLVAEKCRTDAIFACEQAEVWNHGRKVAKKWG